MIALQTENVLPGFGLQVSPAIFGRQQVTLELAEAFTHGHEEQMIGCINSLPWSGAVFNRDESLALFIWFESKEDLKRTKEFIIRKVRKCSSREGGVIREFYGYYVSERRRRTKITITEKQVIRGLNLGPRAPMKTVAERCHRSQRVVRESIRRLADDNLVRVVPHIQPAWARGIELFQLLIYSKDPDTLASAQRLVPYHEVSGRLTEPAGISLWAWTDSLAEQLQIRSAIRDVGVDEVTMLKPVKVMRRLPPGYL